MKNIRISTAQVYMGIIAFLVIFWGSVFGCFAQSTWTNVGTTLQQKVNGTDTLYRIIKSSSTYGAPFKIAYGATKNQLDAFLLARPNHTGTQPISTVAGLQTELDSKIPLTQKATVNGVASLDGSGKVPLSQINDALLGAVNYQGAYNVATNTPTLPTAATSNKGWYYKVSDIKTVFQGDSVFTGDWIISNGVVWDAFAQNRPETDPIYNSQKSTLAKTDGSNATGEWNISITGTSPWVNVLGKPTTIAGYGITNAYTKSESDGKYPLKDGTGSSGTWPIGITGNAATSTLSANSTKWNTIDLFPGTYSSGTIASGLLYNSTNSRVEFGTAAHFQSWLGINNGSTLTNSISGNAATATDAGKWAGLATADNFSTLQSGTIQGVLGKDVNGFAYLYNGAAIRTLAGIPSGGETLPSVVARDNTVVNTNTANNGFGLRYSAGNVRFGLGIGNANGFGYLGSNVNSTIGTDNGTYDLSGIAASRIHLHNGDFNFENSPSGTAGGIITWTNRLKVLSNGDIAAGGKIQITTSTSPITPGDLGYNTASGSYLYGKAGSINDYTLYNNSGTAVMQIPTGTSNVVLAGDVKGNSLSSYSSRVTGDTDGTFNFNYNNATTGGLYFYGGTTSSKWGINNDGSGYYAGNLTAANLISNDQVIANGNITAPTAKIGSLTIGGGFDNLVTDANILYIKPSSVAGYTQFQSKTGTNWGIIDGNGFNGNVVGNLTGNASAWGGNTFVGSASDVAPSYLAGYYSGAEAKYSTQTAVRLFLGLGSNAYSSTSYAPLASPALTGTPTATTATVGTNTTQIATTAFVLANTVSATGNQFGIAGNKSWGGEQTFVRTGWTINATDPTADVAGYNRLYSIPTNAISVGNGLRFRSATTGTAPVGTENKTTDLVFTSTSSKVVTFQDATGTVALTQDIGKSFIANATGNTIINSFSFAHGLSYTPTMVMITPMNYNSTKGSGNDGVYATVDATNVTISTGSDFANGALKWTVWVK